MAFKNRELYLDDVNRDTADAFNTFIRIWNKLDAESHIPIDEREPIKIYINSDGGDLAAAFSIIDTIKMSKTPVWTINTGCAYSSGLEIFLLSYFMKDILDLVAMLTNLKIILISMKDYLK